MEPTNKFLNTFDTVMVLVIAYSCFMSMFFTAFDYKVPEFTAFWYMEIIVFGFFTIDIVCSFMRVPLNDDIDGGISHAEIAKRYFKSGQIIYDTLATFPFFLIKTKDGSSFGLYFKLLRLMRISRIMNLLDMDKMNAFIEFLFANQPRGQRVSIQNFMKTIYKVYKLIFITLILTYFLGCIFYWTSSL